MALSIVNQIKDAVLGVKSNKIDAIIDDSISRIEKFSQTEDKNKFLDAMKKLISVSGADGNSLIKSLSTGSPQVQQYDNSGRISRYAEYDAICAKIPYCERALQCWVDHIVSPDEILKTSLQICPNDRDNRDNDVSVALGRLNSISKHFEIEHKIRGIIKTTLKKGDNFLEIVKTPEGANSLVVLNEAVDPTVFDDFKTVLSKSYPLEIKNVIHEGKKEIVETTKRKIKVVIDEAASSLNLLGGVFTGMTTNLGSPSYPNFPSQYTDVTGVVNNGKSKDKGNSNSAAQYVDDDEFKSNFDKIEKDANKYEIGEDRMKLGDLSLVIHDPKYVIKLETLRFRVCLGYLVFPKVDLINVQSGVINNIDSMCAQLLNDVKQKLSTKIKVSDKLNITDDIKKVLMAHLQHISKNDDLKIRYVNPDLMQHFKLESQKYAPYGESIFDSVLFNCRMYIAQKTACLVKQINASTDKRFISLEIGLPRDAQNVIQQMKESLNKKRVTVDSLGNTDTIPSQISTWENVFIPMKDGKKYVEIDHQQWAPSANDDVDQLKNAEKDICGNLGVPAEFLGSEDSGNRSTLTAQSINFARGIISRQQELTPCLHGFYTKVYSLVWGIKAADVLKKIQITFQLPRIAPMSVNIEFIENSQRAIEALSQLGLSKEYLKRQFMPYIDWDKAESDSIKQKISQETGEEAPENGGLDLGGMGMIPTGGAGMDMSLGGGGLGGM